MKIIAIITSTELLSGSIAERGESGTEPGLIPFSGVLESTSLYLRVLFRSSFRVELVSLRGVIPWGSREGEDMPNSCSICRERVRLEYVILFKQVISCYMFLASRKVVIILGNKLCLYVNASWSDIHYKISRDLNKQDENWKRRYDVLEIPSNSWPAQSPVFPTRLNQGVSWPLHRLSVFSG